jgi:hypothetical protein
MSVHKTSILCLNCLSWGSNPEKTKNEEHRAILEAFESAAAKGVQPGAIVLQVNLFQILMA